MNEFVPCPNKIKIAESLSEQQERITKNVFHTREDDNEVSLSCEDHQFLNIMESCVHKNETGHWKMAFPFHKEKVNFPNNRAQAVSRLNSLLRALTKKAQVEKDNLEFMQKILTKNHVSTLPPEETKSNYRSLNVWYLLHFGVYEEAHSDPSGVPLVS